MAEQNQGASFGPSSREPDPQAVPALAGFDPSRWGELWSASANARYALELWEREAVTAARHDSRFNPELLQWCLERGRQECATLRGFEAILRPLAYGPLRDSDGSPEGQDRNGLDGEAATARAEGIAETPHAD